jgi:hypothetical protein
MLEIGFEAYTPVTTELPGRSPVAIAVGAGRLAVAGTVDWGGFFVTLFDGASL